MNSSTAELRSVSVSYMFPKYYYKTILSIVAMKFHLSVIIVLQLLLTVLLVVMEPMYSSIKNQCHVQQS